jgi:hypothetical protein
MIRLKFEKRTAKDDARVVERVMAIDLAGNWRAALRWSRLLGQFGG